MHEGERGIQLKIPLQKKLAEIREYSDTLLVDHTTRILQLHCCGTNLYMRFNQTFRTADAEKTMHPKLITSDTGQQIRELNCKAEKEKDKKRAEVKKHQKFKVGQVLFVFDDKISIVQRRIQNACTNRHMRKPDSMAVFHLFHQRSDYRRILDVLA
ncbi:transcription initiation factor TFIID subunit 4b [Gossypium raimondii]|uniref:Uncharacterized protein n=2 Tax=Gossypium raimondii TaxID=29730 RepID=A0A0D2QQ49_GOSRA|nr:transcription initiation factor TFIID subunit 4b [Gossypium raimondii]KJB41408.1 hypothetical protein B456_007G102700 [Gossypium raimondii]